MAGAPFQATSANGASRAALAKHDAILDAAKRVFLDEGYSASMDLVAAEAGVSKQTVYNHFGSKEGLFRAIVDELSSELLDVLVERGGTRSDPARTLSALGHRFLGLLLAPASVGLHRMLVAEAPRFPDLAREIYIGGPARAVQELAIYLEEESAKGALEVRDPPLAAEQFFGALRGNLQLRALFDARDAPSEAEVARAVAHAVGVFLHTHGAR